MRLPQYPKLPIPTLKMYRNAAIVSGIVWSALSVWQIPSDRPWLAAANFCLSLIFFLDALLRQHEIRRRLRSYDLPEEPGTIN